MGPKRAHVQENVQFRDSYPPSFAETIVIQCILYFLNSAHLADHFYIGFDG